MALSSLGATPAQSPAACDGRDCSSAQRIWLPAAQIHEIKNRFVVAVRQLVEATAGAYGDEGTGVSASLEVMRRTLAVWDSAIEEYRSLVAKLPESAEVHVALGTVYLDRSRIADALGEFAVAGRLDPRRADLYTLSALALDVDGKSDDASRSLTEATRLDAGNPITFYSLAQQFMKAGKPDQAAGALRTFQTLQAARANADASTPPAPFERVSLLRQTAGVAPIFPLDGYRAGFRRLLGGDYAGALTALATAADADSLVTERAADTGTASAALRAGQLSTALTQLEAASGARPDRSEAHRLLGAAYWADGQFDKSIQQFTAAIRLEPRDERSRIALADVLVEAGRTKDAQQALEDTVRVMPSSGQAHYRLGQLFQSLSLVPAAVREFEAAAALDPLIGVDRLFETIGGLYASQARFDEAAAAYAKRVDVNPNSAEAHLKLGEIYFVQGRDEEALAEYTAAILLDPKNAGAHGSASQAYLRMGRFSEALEAAGRALALEPQLKDARFALATALMRLGRTDEGRTALEAFQRQQADAMANTQRLTELKIVKRDALRALEANDPSAAASLLRQALAIDRQSASVHRDLGGALLRAGRFEEAVQALQAAVKLEDDPDGHRLLADAYRSLGRADESRREAELAASAVARGKLNRLRRIAAR